MQRHERLHRSTDRYSDRPADRSRSTAHITLRFGLPSFIVTLGGLLFWRGAVLLYNGAVQVRFDPEPVFTSLFSGTLFGVNAAFIWIVLFVIGFHLLLHRHQLRQPRLRDGWKSRSRPTAIGINTSRVKLIAFAIAGGMAAVAGIHCHGPRGQRAARAGCGSGTPGDRRLRHRRAFAARRTRIDHRHLSRRACSSTR